MISGVDVDVGKEGRGGVGAKEGGVSEVAVISGEGQWIWGASSIHKFTNDKPQVECQGGQEAHSSSLHALDRKENVIIGSVSCKKDRWKAHISFCLSTRIHGIYILTISAQRL